MLNEEQVKILREVYCKFYDSEVEEWTEVDDHLYALEWLGDDQLLREANIIYIKHSSGKPRCSINHSSDLCFAPKIVEAVGIVIESYEKNKWLHKNHKYILQNYLALTQMEAILS